MQEKNRIGRKKRIILIVSYFVLSAIGFISSYWADTVAWILLNEICAIICLMLAIYWLRFHIKMLSNDV